MYNFRSVIEKIEGTVEVITQKQKTEYLPTSDEIAMLQTAALVQIAESLRDIDGSLNVIQTWCERHM